MEIKRDTIFNLMDTNGRRNDVLNALKIYLEILEELKDEYPTDVWGVYPESIAQFKFYEKALEKSKDVFKVHKNYDSFMESLGDHYQAFLDRDITWIKENFLQIKKSLDEAIEMRSRHYTNNLVKMGFTDEDRNITEAGYSYLRNTIHRDLIEDLLPLDNINISLLRQLLKLKIFGEKKENGMRPFYSPFLMALVLLLADESIDKDSFALIIQGLTPYSDENLKNSVKENTISLSNLESAIRDKEIKVPSDLVGKETLDFSTFKHYFKNKKSKESSLCQYYNFFIVVKNFYFNRNIENYNSLLKCIDKNSELLNKAFGYGKAIFNCGNRGKRYDLAKFLVKNANHPLLNCSDIIAELFSVFAKSKWVDGIKEYTDTTIRLLSATGLFKFKNLPDLSYKDVLKLIFNVENIRKNIFGEMSQDEYLKYENSADCFFGRNTPISEILGYSTKELKEIVGNIETHFSLKSARDVKDLLQHRKNSEFLQHITDKYPKETIMELLPLFSDRKKDSVIQKAVNEIATVPTIYEYVIGIAWFYISNKSFDLYNSLNLTLDADFEPVLHAGGGEGDIVIDYDDITVMLEVTLMNKQAQKRGEWEPVLRHSLNLRASNETKDSITFFIADELDYNTVNIWRAVVAVPLESTNTHQKVSGVIIMPFTNNDILKFLKNNVSHSDIISRVKDSFAQVPQIKDIKWHEDIVNSLSKSALYPHG